MDRSISRPNSSNEMEIRSINDFCDAISVGKSKKPGRHGGQKYFFPDLHETRQRGAFGPGDYFQTNPPGSAKYFGIIISR